MARSESGVATPTAQSAARNGMDLGLKGKVAMVAGASRGLGFAVARALAHEGALVSISSRDERAIAAAAEQLGADNVLATPLDVRSADGIVRWAQLTEDRFGGVDLLFAKAVGRRQARHFLSTMRRGRARSICCSSARCAWFVRRCRRWSRAAVVRSSCPRRLR